MSFRSSDDSTFSFEADAEKGHASAFPVSDRAPHHAFDTTDRDRVQRRLKQRHVQMFAIAGTLGTGLFLGSGNALANAGPVGALIAYALVGSVAYSMMSALGEMTSHAPISGTFPYFAARWVDPALGFAVGWIYFYSSVMSVPVEITAGTIILTFWDNSTMHQYLYIVLIIVVILAINVYGVRCFGETEFGLSTVKLTLLVVFIIVGIIIDLGGGPHHDRLGFRFWKNPGAFAGPGLVQNTTADHFLGFLSALAQAGFSFQGIELAAIAASETESPRRNIRKAMKRVFFRVTVFYIVGIFVAGLLVSSTDMLLLHQSGSKAASPFVIAIKAAGIKVLPSLANAAIFAAAVSAANSYLFCGSRVLYGLALRGQAPAFLARCTRHGVPVYAVMFSCSFGLLAFMNMTDGSARVFGWLVDLSAVSGFLVWGTINLTHIFFCRGMIAQGLDRRRLVYHSKWQPWLSYWGLCCNILLLLMAGLPVFFKWNTSDFFAAYINIPIFALYLFWKFYQRTSICRPTQMDFLTGIPTVEETELPPDVPTTIGEKLAAKLF